MNKTFALISLALLVRVSQAQPAAPTSQQTTAELHKQFVQMLTNATLAGRYTTSDDDKAVREDRYTILSVTHLLGDNWVFKARIQYGGKDVTVPLVLPVKWAGDTPMISVTDLGIPGLGTYTARVMFYKDHYAGMWSGHDHGGVLWGKIEHQQTPPEGSPKND